MRKGEGEGSRRPFGSRVVGALLKPLYFLAKFSTRGQDRRFDYNNWDRAWRSTAGALKEVWFRLTRA